MKELPEALRRLVEGKSYTVNDVGMSGAEVRVFDDMILKCEKRRAETENQFIMMNYLRGKLPVPEVIFHMVDGDEDYLLYTKVGGTMACDMRYLQNGATLCERLAEVLHCLWETDISDCPSDFGTDTLLTLAEEKLARGGYTNLECPEGFSSARELLTYLKAEKPQEEKVLTHGDLCLPNIFLDANGFCGLIDLGRAGAADRWRDIAICHRSLRMNLRGAWGGHKPIDFDADTLLRTLGIPIDREKMRYYLLLDEMC